MEIIIHIGIPKTGSSAVQSHLLTNRQWFRQRGLFIPTSGFTPGSGHNLLFGVTDTATAPRELVPYLGRRGYLPELLAEVATYREQGCNAVLLSWEGFAMLDQALIEKLASGLSGYRIRLLAYLREQSALTESMILQRVKSNLWHSPLFDYLEEKVPVPTPGFLDFFDVLSGWSRAFSGRIAIETRLYAKQSLVGNNIVTDFADWLRLPIDESFALQTADNNPSLDATGAALVSLAGAAGLDRPGKAVLIEALLRDLYTHPESSRSLLPAATLERIRAQYQQSNRRVQREFPPANQDPEHRPELFAQAARDAQPRANPFLQLACRLNSLIENPEPVLWLGERLEKHRLSAVTKDIGRGWRRPGNKGIWSVDDSSEIIFRIPRLNPGDKPVYLLLGVEGSYYGANSSTRVEFGDSCDRYDLTRATIRLSLNEQTLQRDIHLTLHHDEPASPLQRENKKDPSRLAFMLQSLSYAFAWD